MDTNNEIKRVNEDELEEVSGGVGATSDCWFQWGGSSGKHWRESDTLPCSRVSCFKGLTQCACHGTDRCVGKMHKMDNQHTTSPTGAPMVRAQPHPFNHYNHGSIWIEYEVV